MLRYKAVIFDLDGTLLDSVPGIKLTLNMLTKKLGLPELTDEQMQNCIGPPINKFFPEVLHIPEDRLEDALAAYRSLFNEYALEGLALFKGIPALLQALRDKGALLGVATCKVRPSAITQLEIGRAHV